MILEKTIDLTNGSICSKFNIILQFIRNKTFPSYRNFMKHNKSIGNKGEQAAMMFLKKKGYEILDTNWRFRRAEIDIIARLDEVLVFIEVKTRSYDYFGKPENFVTTRKKELMADAASAYMERIGHSWEIRFDIISILLRGDMIHQIHHFEDAFFPGIH